MTNKEINKVILDRGGSGGTPQEDLASLFCLVKLTSKKI